MPTSRKPRWGAGRTLITVLVLAIGLAGLAACGSSVKSVARTPASVRPAPDLTPLLNEGTGDTASDYFKPVSTSLVAAAAGAENQQFYALGQQLVKDGLSDTIIDLGREMNGSWYEWSERRAPPSEPDAYILAWRQAVTAMRKVPGQHFKFLWTLYPTGTSAAQAWPGRAYVDYVGTDIFDWYGGPKGTYPHTASGALDHQEKWQQILTEQPGGLNWTAAFAQAAGKPIIIPEWALDFHTFGGQDDTMFITDMLAWMKAHDAIGLYWAGGHVTPAAEPSGPKLARQGAAAQENTPAIVNGYGNLLGGTVEYAGVYLPDQEALADSTDQPLLSPWENTPYRLVLSVPLVPNPPAIPSYSGPPAPGNKIYQLPDYPDAVAALQAGA